jgi:hypothetical protein
MEVVAPALNPPIYGAKDKSAGALTMVDILRAAVNDKGCMHAIAADAAWDMGARLVKSKQFAEASRLRVEGSFYFFEAIKSLQLKLENPKEMHACSTIITRCHLAGVAVSVPHHSA